MFKGLSKDTVIQRKHSSETVQTILDQRKELCAIVTSNPSAKAAFKALKRIGATGFAPSIDNVFPPYKNSLWQGKTKVNYDVWFAYVRDIQVTMWRNKDGEWSYA